MLLVDHLDWSFTDTSISFGLTIFSLGISAAWAGIMLPKIGPRKLAVAGSALFCTGYFIASYALHIDNLGLFLFGYGFVGGTGLGFGYVVPVATVANWFPEHKGLSTGLVVMGFGLGALFLSKLLAPALLVQTEENLPQVFFLLGVLFACILLPASFFVTNPPHIEVDRKTPLQLPEAEATEEDRPDYVRRCLKSYEFIIMWLIFFFNIAAGISVISFQSPLLQDVWKLNDASIEPEVLAIYGANLIAARELDDCCGVCFPTTLDA